RGGVLHGVLGGGLPAVGEGTRVGGGDDLVRGVRPGHGGGTGLLRAGRQGRGAAGPAAGGGRRRRHRRVRDPVDAAGTVRGRRARGGRSGGGAAVSGHPGAGIGRVAVAACAGRGALRTRVRRGDRRRPARSRDARRSDHAPGRRLRRTRPAGGAAGALRVAAQGDGVNTEADVPFA
ncbi:hypothetical protein E1293_19425, partial [Actinomadura darangshiensis]